MDSLKRAVALAFLLACMPALACPKSDGAPGSLGDLTVVSPSLSLTENDGPRMVNTFGMLRNASADCFHGLAVEVRYFDAKGKFVDTITQPLYNVVVTGKQEVAFRVRDAAAQPKEAYASQSIRLIAADTRHERGAKQSSSSFLMEVLISWGPMILLIGIWVFFMERMKSKDSPQGRTLAAITRQNSILEAQNELLGRIAITIETRSSPHADT